jgi:hypothetical protein
MRIDKQLITGLMVAAGLVGVAVVWRLVNHATMVAPNLELVTAVTLVASVFLHRYYAMVVPLMALFVSDVLIGNGTVAIFVWSAFVVIGLLGMVLKRFKGEPKRLILGTAGMGLGSAVFFFAWTNFGVWLLGDGTFYPHTWMGLMQCYAMGIPFFRTTLISGVVLAPLVMAAAVYLPALVKIRQLSIAKA